jgi:hypothetical protein
MPRLTLVGALGRKRWRRLDDSSGMAVAANVFVRVLEFEGVTSSHIWPVNFAGSVVGGTFVVGV